MKIKTLFGGMVIFILVLALNTPWISHITIDAQTTDRIVSVAEAPDKPVALILGAAAYNPEKPSDILQDRVDTGIELYKAGKVDKLIMSGAHNEVVAMANAAIKQGVPTQNILADGNGYNTLASIANIAQDYPSALIVTQEYHLPRALFYARHFGMEAMGVRADKREYEKMKAFKKRELIAQMKAFADVYVFSWFLPLERIMELNKKLDTLG